MRRDSHPPRIGSLWVKKAIPDRYLPPVSLRRRDGTHTGMDSNGPFLILDVPTHVADLNDLDVGGKDVIKVLTPQGMGYANAQWWDLDGYSNMQELASTEAVTRRAR